MEQTSLSQDWDTWAGTVDGVTDNNKGGPLFS